MLSLSLVGSQSAARPDRESRPGCCTVVEQPKFRDQAGGVADPRIKSLSGGSSREFTGVRAAGRTARAYLSELGRTAVNCNPNCNPGLDDHPVTGSKLVTQQW